jgi:hypothetical protein
MRAGVRRERRKRRQREGFAIVCCLLREERNCEKRGKGVRDMNGEKGVYKDIKAGLNGRD